MRLLRALKMPEMHVSIKGYRKASFFDTITPSCKYKNTKQALGLQRIRGINFGDIFTSEQKEIRWRQLR